MTKSAYITPDILEHYEVTVSESALYRDVPMEFLDSLLSVLHFKGRSFRVRYYDGTVESRKEDADTFAVYPV